MSIPVLISLNPYTLEAGVPQADQRLIRGGLVPIGTASPSAGGGPVYVAILSGAVVQYDPATGLGTRVKDTGTYTPLNYLRFDGARVAAQPTFDWLNPNPDNSPAYAYTCLRTDQ